MAKRRKKAKGRRRGGKRRGKKRGRVMKHKPGIAESLGLLKTGIGVAHGSAGHVKATLKEPTMANIENTAVRIWDSAKANIEPAALGIAVSNMDKLPIVGKMVRPLKRKADRILKSYTGMGL